MLGHLFDSLLKKGTLTAILPGGRRVCYGRGEPRVTIRLHDSRAVLALVMNPDLKLGELYMDGRLTVEEGGDVSHLLALLMHNLSLSQPTGWHRLTRIFRNTTRLFAQFNPAVRAKRNVAHHYDLSGELYARFLDRDRQYSCAYFQTGEETIDEAQIAKKRHIAAKLLLNKPGLRVLDIGCGWGGLALDIARDANATVLGITLSEEQIAVARERSEKAHLSECCRFELADYRTLRGSYDRIVSVGMFEHVGVPHYAAFFSKVRQLLADDGVMLLHTIGRLDGPGSTNPWVAKYIFPGGYVPSLSELTAAVEENGLLITDIEVLRLHYAKTLAEWRRRFDGQRAEIAKLYDERFCRMWEFYLAGAEMAFRYDNEAVFQVQIVKHQEALPLTRDYMFDGERSMNFTGAGARPVRAA